jgi:dipeptidyl aminopeptidase/acylaminoacyl peptidase
VLVHGGPEGSWEDGWHMRWNLAAFAARGYVVVATDFHGSIGYGQKFKEAIVGDWGGLPYDDVMRATDAAEKLPFVEPGHTCAAGASYGGYLIDWIAGHTDRFRCLVSHDDVYDTVAEYGSTEELWFPEWEFRGPPWKSPELYRKFSPSSYAQNFKTPTLVVQGELDFRVPVEQGLGMFTALQRQGVESKLLYFPDEGHWVLKPRNSQLWYHTVLDWIDAHAKSVK